MKSKNCEKGNIHLIGIPSKERGIALEHSIKALDRAKNLLKYKKQVDVVIIEAQNFFVISKLGIGGSAIGKFCIEIKIDFSRKDLRKIIDIELSATVYHELAHLVRENSVGYGNTLLDSFVSEGISCFVEKSILPKRKIPYIQKIKSEQKLWAKAKKLLGKIKYNHSEWFFGSGKLPNWTGYRLGYLIVEKFTKRNIISLAELSRLNSKDILKGSKLL